MLWKQIAPATSKFGLAALVALLGLSRTSAQTTGWINEFHYDNSGTDQGEFIEVASTAGTNTASWTLYLYNRANEYSSKALSTCTSSDTGRGVVLTYCDFPTNGIQNGNQDAIALVDDSLNTVLDFLSYEGSRKAKDGPAAGLTPVNVGVQETSSTPAGYSLQKMGSGCSRDDFSWNDPTVQTKGTANNGQTFSCGGAPTSPSPSSSPTPAPTRSPTASPTRSPTASPTSAPTASPANSPVAAPPTSPAASWINEFHYDNSGTDLGEFVEIAYTSGISDITSYTVVFYNGNGGAVYRTESVPVGSLVSGGAYLSVISLPTNGIQNGAPDGMALVDGNGNVVEFLSYEGTLTATDGPANGQTSDNIGVSETSSTAVGSSLQRSGSGCAGTDFTWSPSGTATSGTVNNGQTISCGPAPPTPPPSRFPTVSPTMTAAPSIPAPPTSSMGIKVMTFNILQGGGTSSGWKDIVKAENADVVVFTEVGNWDDNNDALLNQYLNEFNTYFTGETPYVGSTVQGISFANSANAIMTRFPIVQTTQLTDNELTSASAHDLMVWKLDVGNSKFVYTIGIHLKCCGGATNDSRRNDTMQKLLEWIDANTNASDGVMLMGDFNSVSPIDTDPTFPGYQAGFEPSSGSTLNDGPLRMLLDSSDPRASSVHTFQDAFRVANPTCGSNPSCCADTLCDSSLSTNCPERGYSYVGDTHDFDSRIDFIIVNQQVQVTGAATTGDLTGNNVCTASDHLPVDAIVSFGLI